MICNIGKDLGTIQDHELTKTTARVRVLVDGLKPLTKEAIVEFDSGEESIIYLEYEKLENHCSRCYLMSHLKKDCPSYLMETQREESQQSGKLITYKKEVLPEQNGMHQSSRQQSPDRYYREYNSKATGEGRADTFHERVDRHGNIFGARVATKQTRVPPPPKVLENIRDDHHSWRGKGLEAETETQIQSYNSPPYTKRRDLGKERNMFKKAPFPQRGLSEWRGEAPQEAYKEQTEAQILNELNEATLLYLSCPDPTEAAARRQRVLAGDAMGQTQERVASLLRLQGSSSDQRRDTTQDLQIPGPPGIDFDVAMQPSDIEDTPPPVMRRAAPHQDVDSLPEKQVQSPNDGINSGRLKSIIVTPTDGRSEEQEEAREVVEIADDEETLLQFQSKKKKRSSNSIILRSPRLYPSILRGASSKKRKLS
ncbi:unnamed protein product [Brassica oleracea]